MCFRFGSCFGSGSSQDHGYYSGVDHKAPPADQPRPAADEPGRRVDHNSGGGGGGRWSQADHGYYSRADHKPAYRQPAPINQAVHDAGGRGGYSPYVQDKAGETLKHPAAWKGKVSDDTHTYAARLHEAAAAANGRENAATDHHNYPATATTTLARY